VVAFSLSLKNENTILAFVFSGKFSFKVKAKTALTVADA
jgi:hypothetical protein